VERYDCVCSYCADTLLIPVGHDYVTFAIENCKVVSAYMKTDSGVSEVLCGINVSGGCISEGNLGTHGNEIPDKSKEKDASEAPA
jgi:hypothetical protein